MSDTITSNNFSQTVSNTFANLQVNNAFILKIIAISITIILAISIFGFIYNKLTLRRKECNNMSKLYTDFPKLSSFNSDNPKFQFALRDYYVKTAYNACSIGNFKNNFVDLCSLKNIIRQGARCLDFEVYSINNEPVIATSSIDSFDVKETYNSIPFSAVLETISNYAFSGGTCPNPNDPIIIHLRIQSQNSVIFNKMAQSFKTHLENRVMGKSYSYENNGNNFANIPLSQVKGKVILAIDKSNPLFEGTDLDEYVNIASNSIFMRSLRFNDVKFTHDMNELIDFNKKNMTIVLPDLTGEDNNYSSSLAMKYGCQLIALSFQNFDDNMEYYDQFFDEAGTAFVLKPENLRFIPLTINKSSPPPESYSYKPREVTSDFYGFNI
jgi:hypothetical protein